MSEIKYLRKETVEKTLPEHDGQMKVSVEYETARDEIEGKLVDLWKEVLQIENLSITDNFFDLGGHSLKAISLVSKIHEEINVEVPLIEMFKTPTIKGLTEYVKGKKSSDFAITELTKENICSNSSEIQGKELECYEEQVEYGVTPRMAHVWEVMKKTNDYSYNIEFLLMLEGKVDINLLNQSINEIIDKHEVLRTNLIEKDGSLKMSVGSNKGLELIVIDLIDRNDISDIKKYIGKEISVTFDYEKELMIKAWLFKIENGRNILAFSMPHLISDGWSISIIKQELIEAYNNNFRSTKEKNVQKVAQFKEYVTWINNTIVNDINNTQRVFWANKFAGKQLRQTLPYDEIKPDEYNPGICKFNIEAEKIDSIKMACSKNNMSVSMFLTIITNIMLTNWINVNEITVSLIVDGRTADYHNSIGYYTNTVYWNFTTDISNTISEYMEKSKYSLLELFSNRLCPNYCVEDDLRTEHPNSIYINFQTFDHLYEEIGDLKITDVIPMDEELEGGSSFYDLGISAKTFMNDSSNLKNEIVMYLEYNKQCFNFKTISKLKELFLVILDYILINKNNTLEMMTNHITQLSDSK